MILSSSVRAYVSAEPVDMRKQIDGLAQMVESRKPTAELGHVSHMSIARIWAKHALKPHRIEG
jgi:hypothetical protein